MKKSMIFAIITIVLGGIMLASVYMQWVSRTVETKKGVEPHGEQSGQELLDNEVTVHLRDGGTETFTMERYVRKRNPDGKSGLGFDHLFIYAVFAGAGLMIIGGGIAFAKSTIGLALGLTGASIVAVMMLISLPAGFFIENNLQTEKEEFRDSILQLSSRMTDEERSALLERMDSTQTHRHMGFFLAFGLGVIGTIVTYVGWSGEKTRNAFAWDDEEEDSLDGGLDDDEDTDKAKS